DTVESILARCSAGPAFARAVREAGGEVNTDDRTVVEFGFGRQVGHRSAFSTWDLMVLADARREGRAEVQGAVDWSEVQLAGAFVSMRTDPWATPRLVGAGLELATALASQSPGTTAALLHALEEPFAVGLMNETRLGKRLELALREGSTEACLRALAPMEP